VIDAARPCRHSPGDRWFADETYVKVAGRWVYLYRAIDQFGQVIDVLVSEKRDLAATRRFFIRMLQHGTHPREVTTDRAQAYPRVLDELPIAVMSRASLAISPTGITDLAPASGNATARAGEARSGRRQGELPAIPGASPTNSLAPFITLGVYRLGAFLPAPGSPQEGDDVGAAWLRSENR
jgi:hypothetical protein